MDCTWNHMERDSQRRWGARCDKLVAMRLRIDHFWWQIQGVLLSRRRRYNFAD